ncbi:MAG: transporter substrate-binding domain-containing protein [Rhodoferax sp.]|nr:transporter substrate-binding domain-containing protein [Rhodoferax sp.]
MRPRSLTVAQIWIAALGACAMVPCIAQDSTRIECVSDIYTPYVMAGPAEGEVTGIDAELLVAAGLHAGLTIVPRIMPWARVEAELRKGADSRIDCAFAFSRTVPREAYMVFGAVPLKVTQFTLFAKGARGRAPYLGPAQLTGSRIGVRAAFRVPDDLQAAASRGEVTLETVTDDEFNFRKLVLNRVDYVLTNQDVGATQIHRLGLTGIHSLSPAVMELPTYIVLRTGYPQAAALQKALDKGLLAARAGQTEQRLRDQYLR